jgi:SAM-dependent methyltransferase
MLSAKEANRRYFQNAYRTGRHGWETDEPSPYAIEFIGRLSRLVPGGRLLDVGCGEGRHAIAAARVGFRAVGIDYEPLAIKRARQFARAAGVKHVNFQKAGIFSLPFPDDSFDIVLDYGCLHHQRKSDWLRYRVSILRVLKPRGFFILSVFSPRFRLFGGSRRPWHIAYGAYRRYFTRRDILDLFGREFKFLRLIEERGGGQGFWHALMQRRD